MNKAAGVVSTPHSKPLVLMIAFGPAQYRNVKNDRKEKEMVALPLRTYWTALAAQEDKNQVVRQREDQDQNIQEREDEHQGDVQGEKQDQNMQEGDQTFKH